MVRTIIIASAVMFAISPAGSGGLAVRSADGKSGSAVKASPGAQVVVSSTGQSDCQIRVEEKK